MRANFLSYFLCRFSPFFLSKCQKLLYNTFMKRLFVLAIVLTFTATTFCHGAKNKKTTKQPPDDVYVAGRSLDGSYNPKKITGSPVPVTECWGWVMQGKESEISKASQLTDIGYFAADVDTYGHLSGVPKRSNLKKVKQRVHLVLVCDSKSLTHFVLTGAEGLREKLINDVMDSSTPFDGVQVDYELIPNKDYAAFYEFLSQLSDRVHKANKLFSVCVPARTRLLKDDAFPYSDIAAISDRVMIMAYDEHWSTSKPGPVASVEWCRSVAKYAATVIPQDKLVMGLPFYGRTWADIKTAQGWYNSGVNRILRQYDHDAVRYINDVPSTRLKMGVKVTCYFEDAYSTVVKMRTYNDLGVKKIAFWRIGQEDPHTWRWIKIVKDEDFLPPPPNRASSTPASSDKRINNDKKGDKEKGPPPATDKPKSSDNKSGSYPKDFIVIDSSTLFPKKSK